jgi:hypothetical protein
MMKRPVALWIEIFWECDFGDCDLRATGRLLQAKCFVVGGPSMGEAGAGWLPGARAVF